jgi:hypothetical protein
MTSEPGHDAAMIRRLLWLWPLACGCSAGPDRPGAPVGAAGPSRTVRPGDIAIADVSVVPMSTDGVLAHRTVVIRGDRIVAVARGRRSGAGRRNRGHRRRGQVADARLTDMHVPTWDEDELTMFVAAGVTTVRNMWGAPQHLTWRSDRTRRAAGPTIVTAGPLIDGDPPDWPGSVMLTDPAGADALVAEQKAAGYDFLKPVSRLSRAAFAAAGERHGMALSGHVPLAGGLDGVLAARQAGTTHAEDHRRRPTSPWKREN